MIPVIEIDSVAWVRKRDLTKEQIKSLELNLSIPNPNFNRWDASSGQVDYRERVNFFREDDLHYIVPRGFLKQIFNKGDYEVNPYTEPGEDIDIEFTGTLRSYQQEFVDMNPQYLKPNDRIFVAGCGSGKTIMSIWTLCQYKKATLVLVPTNYLVGQYLKSCESVTKGATIVAAKSSKGIDWGSADVLIITYKLFLNREFPPEFYRKFGHFIVDEGHRIGSDTYEDIVPRVPANRRTLLTATLRREDGAAKIIRYHFGRVFEMASPNPKVECIPVDTGYKIESYIKLKKGATHVDRLKNFFASERIKCTQYKDYLVVEKWFNLLEQKARIFAGNKTLDSYINQFKRNKTQFNFSALDTIVSLIPERNDDIAKFAHAQAKSGRKVLVLSKRKEQLHILSSIISDLGSSSFVVVSGVSEDDIPEDYEIILGIDKMAKEGLDLPSLDLLVLAHPIGDTEQAFGRVARITDDGKKPQAYYLIDDTEAYRKLFNKSLRYIKKNGFISERQNGLRVRKASRAVLKKARGRDTIPGAVEGRKRRTSRTIRKSVRGARFRFKQ